MGVGRIRKKRIFFNLNRKRKKSNQKLKKVVDAYIRLLEREQTEGSTKRIKHAKEVCKNKMRKFGIVQHQIDQRIKEKGLTHLSSK